MTSKTSRPGIPGCFKLAGMATALALASQTHAQGEGELIEITVTAQFREQNLQQTPIAITAFNSEMMEARSQTNIAEVAAQAPNVTLTPNSAAYGPSMTASIRGVGQTDFNPAYEPGVGLYVDDVYYATLTGSVFDLLDLDRVEILRGPQGTLAGKNSIGGAVRLYSRQPEGDGSGNLRLTYGIRDRVDLRASADIALTDSWAARLAGVSKRQDGYVDRIDYGCAFPDSGVPALRLPSAGGHCVSAREGEIDYQGMRAMLRFDDGGAITASFIADYTHDDRAQAPSVLIAADYPGDNDINPFDVPLAYDARFVPPPDSYYNFAAFANLEDGNLATRIADGRSRFEGWGLSAQVDWDLSPDLLLESITGYRAYDSGFSNDNDLSPLAHSFGDGTLDFWSWSQEFRLSGSFGQDLPVEWTAGAFYMDQKSVYASLQDLRYSGLPPFYQDDPTEADSKAVFAHLNWYLSELWTLTTGLRWTDESKSYTFSRLTPEGGEHPVLSGLHGVVGEYEGDRLDYRLSAQYQLRDNLMTYAQIATGFKGGGVNPRPFFATQVQPFDQELLTSYELGAKSELLDRRLRLNAALFFSEYEDKQLTASSCPDFSPTGTPCALPINAGDADMWGFELEADMQLGAWMVDGSISWLDFEYQRVNPLAADISIDNVAPYTPELKWSVGAQYELGLGELGTLTPRVDVSYQDEVYTDASNSPLSLIDDYTLVNARLMWASADQSWEAALEFTNLLDEYYFLTIFDQFDNNGMASGQPGRPFEWAFTIERAFF